jgi:hypothetical protein
VELKGVRSGVERRRGRASKARDPGRRETPGRERKSSRIGVYRANAVVREPVYV